MRIIIKRRKGIAGAAGNADFSVSPVRLRSKWRSLPPTVKVAALLLVVLGVVLATSLLFPLLAIAAGNEGPVWVRLLLVVAMALVMALVALPFLALLSVALIGFLNRRPWGWWILMILLGLFAVVQGIVFLLASLERPAPFALLGVVQIGLAVTTFGFLLARSSRAWFKQAKTEKRPEGC